MPNERHDDLARMLRQIRLLMFLCLVALTDLILIITFPYRAEAVLGTTAFVLLLWLAIWAITAGVDAANEHHE